MREDDMSKVEVMYKGFRLIPLAAYDDGTYASMLIIGRADESQRASSVLGSFVDADSACQYAIEYGIAQIDRGGVAQTV
jgi:hypothetical protein